MKLCVLLLLIPFSSFAQVAVDEQISWSDAKNWRDVLAQAKQQDKYIFIDAFATWCGPCKLMEKHVFTAPSIYNLLNNRFVSVRIQMDKTSRDNKNVQGWYADAKQLMERYKVAGFPTFLFLSPSGDLVYKAYGYQDTMLFLETIREAIHPERLRLNDLIREYKAGKKNYVILPDLVRYSLDNLRDTSLSQLIAYDYKAFLDRQSDEKLLNRKTLSFIRENRYLITSSNDKFFSLLFKNPNVIDSILKINGFSRSVIAYVITKEEFWHKLFKDEAFTDPVTNDPDWTQISASIKAKYGASYASEIINSQKQRFYQIINNWHGFAKAFEDEMTKDPPTRQTGIEGWPWKLNTTAWNVFLHCHDSVILKKALSWSELSIKLEQPSPNVQYLDTRANILYKLGRVKEGIEQEQNAIALDSTDAIRNGQTSGLFVEEYTDNINKMKKGIPTWPQK